MTYMYVLLNILLDVCVVRYFPEKTQKLFIDENLRYDRLQLGDHVGRYTPTNFIEKEARIIESVNNYILGW